MKSTWHSAHPALLPGSGMCLQEEEVPFSHMYKGTRWASDNPALYHHPLQPRYNLRLPLS